ncbi:MAG: DNA-3-methyladenine glycosylase I [Candidatus Bathyarchaeota archaeon]|nr:DNA-3-methyladenine glycosylase I [Candidatus Bathyarchaeota archaeon]
MDAKVQRCWSTEKPLYIRYHDEEWGVPLHDDNKLFEFLILDGFQAGLSWWIILEKRNTLREAFDNFDPAKVAKYSHDDVDRIMSASGVIKNKAKILSAISNAQQFLKIQAEFGSFDAFIWKFVNGKTINNNFTSLSQIPAETEESKAMSTELKRRGFKFVGPTICYAFMQAAGLVNDHLINCFRHQQIREAECNLP